MDSSPLVRQSELRLLTLYLDLRTIFVLKMTVKLWPMKGLNVTTFGTEEVGGKTRLQ